MESRSLLLRELDNLCNDVSLLAMDLPSKKGLDLDEVMADTDLDNVG